ncbi:SH3 domain-containing protein [Vibrio sp. S11_S32]|uniref:SH3 domain-containing protein n=1 Tax=Vibrio sp. S11_S32 TaxID=2720225 RepID=UPI0016817218|nr:SH3 domain-containing protein [Vibrio sp. S11_S32]MBD1575273.1 SH3 domain-containing protein [Vibrio sp. S11_S32]
MRNKLQQNKFVFNRLCCLSCIVLLSGCQILNQSVPGAAFSPSTNQPVSMLAKMGNDIDQALSSDGQKKLLNQINIALESYSRRNFTEQDKISQSSWSIAVGDNNVISKTLKRQVTQGVTLDIASEWRDLPYLATTTVNLRSEPSSQSEKVGQLQKGERFTALVRVNNKRWFMVEQHDVVLGYVHMDYVHPMNTDRTLLSTYPSAFNIDPHTITEQESALLTSFKTALRCKSMTYTLSNQAQETQSPPFTVCRKALNRWYIQTHQ